MREHSRLGGINSAAKLSPQKRIERSTENGYKTLSLYGVGFYAAMARKGDRDVKARRAQ